MKIFDIGALRRRAMDDERVVRDAASRVEQALNGGDLRAAGEYFINLEAEFEKFKQAACKI